MLKIISFIMFELILYSDHFFAQQGTFGYKISGNEDIISNVFLIRDGFILDSVLLIPDPIFHDNETYKFEYNEDGKLKRDINFIKYSFYTEHGELIRMPGCRDYFYNERGDIDSIIYGKWNDTLKLFEYTDGLRIKYAYDTEGRLLLETHIDNGFIPVIKENNYDSYGNLILTKIITLADTTYNIRGYDSQNRLILTKAIHSSNPWYYTQRLYQYDSSGNINCTDQPIGFYDIQKYYFLKFDESGKMISEIHRNFDSADSTWSENFEILFNYDENGRIVKMGEASRFHYNTDGNPDTLINPPIEENNGYLSNSGTLIDSYGNIIKLTGYELVYLYYSELTTSINKEKINANNFILSQNYPNPFNPMTTISYSLPKISFVTLKIYDILGKEIASLVNEEKQSGTYNVTWDAQDMTSGIYFYKITAGEHSKVNKMMLLK